MHPKQITGAGQWTEWAVVDEVDREAAARLREL
jgi:hypothetical protein